MFSENEKLNSVFLLKHHFKDHSLALKNCFGSKVPVGTFTNHVKVIFEKVLNMTLSNLSVQGISSFLESCESILDSFVLILEMICVHHC